MRKKFQEEDKQIPKEKKVHLDESGIDIGEKKQYGYAKKNERCFDQKHGKKTKRISMISAMNHKRELIAPMYFEGYTDSKLFETWLKKSLLPNLEKGTTIILDNASFHKGRKAEEIVRKFNCFLKFLSPYSPDLNPIETKWSEIKGKIRKEPVNLRNWRKRIETGFI